MIAAIIALAPAIIQALLMVLKWIGGKTLEDKEQINFLNALVEVARVANLPDLVKKFEMAEEQLKKNNAKWDEIERLEKEKK